jgi:tetratricopeptide (TPR) repeat protein
MIPSYWVDFNDVWDYNDPAGTEKRFRSLLDESAKTQDQDYLLQLKTQIARTLGLQGKFDEAHSFLDEVEKAMAPGSLVEVRYLLERGRALNSSKRPEAAMPLFLRASNVALALKADFYTVDALHMLGIAAPQKDRLTWNLKAIETAQESDEKGRGWLASLYNNTGWSLFDEQRYAEALDLFQKAVPLREQQGKAEETRIAKWSVAKVLRVMGRVEEALVMQRGLVASEPDDGFINEELGECLLALGRGRKLNLVSPRLMPNYCK